MTINKEEMRKALREFDLRGYEKQPDFLSMYKWLRAMIDENEGLQKERDEWHIEAIKVAKQRDKYWSAARAAQAGVDRLQRESSEVIECLREINRLAEQNAVMRDALNMITEVFFADAEKMAARMQEIAENTLDQVKEEEPA